MPPIPPEEFAEGLARRNAIFRTSILQIMRARAADLSWQDQGLCSRATSWTGSEIVVAALSDRIAPASTAVVTMEVQRGVVGDQAALPALAAEVAESGMIANVARLCGAARTAGARVVHCTAAFRPDGAGSKANARILAASRKSAGGRMDIGSPGVELVPELGPDPADIVVQRLHGLTPFTSTSLDQILRNLGISTVIATGVSLNVGVLGLVLTAVDLGYQVVVARDAVAAIPASYADPLFDNTVSMLATVCTTAEIESAWRG